MTLSFIASSLALFLLAGAILAGALRHLGTARTGAYFATAPFVGAAGSILALGEPRHVHRPFRHGHPHYPDLHYRRPH
jgi:drug/metabolite transporter (DMT)-like permease